MAEIQQAGDSGKGKHSKVRAKKSSTHIDMTPMVDLAFLLLTFFIFTTTFSKPKTMDITMPVKDKEAEPTKVPGSQSLTLLLTANDKIVWFMGVDSGETAPITNTADFSLNGPRSIHKLLLEKNKLVYDQVRLVEDSVKRKLIEDDQQTVNKHKAQVKAAEKKGLIVLIKPDSTSKYKNLVDILDEMLITNVARYAIVDLTPSEKELIKNTQ